jgi:hypothetical protein
MTYSGQGDGGVPDERITDWLVFAAINDASWIRARLPHAGTYVYSARIDSDTAISYELHVAPVIATGASWPTGSAATVIIRGSLRTAILPAAMSGAVQSDSAWQQFAVSPGTYRALLVRDSVYVACALPCRQPRRLVLRPAQVATIDP